MIRKVNGKPGIFTPVDLKPLKTDPRCHGNEILHKVGYNSACVGNLRDPLSIRGFRG